MDTQRQHEQEQNRPPDEQILRALIDEEDSAANGIPVVRTNTPRPLSFARSSAASEQASTSGSLLNAADFPVEAPGAPPLPEEPEEGERGASVATIPVSSGATLSEQTGESAPEFIWLFEYGLEMDEGYLNSPGRLNGQAHIYGPAVLKGYCIEGIRLRNGQMALSLAKDSSPDSEVWGVLYRVPRKLAEPLGSEPSMLDKAHASHLFSAVPVVAQEMYRKRAVQCVTYMFSETADKDFVLPAPLEAHVDHSYARRLLTVARQQHLPEAYLQALATLIEPDAEEPASPAIGRIEQNTEPLPVIDSAVLPAHVPVLARSAPPMPTPRGWLLALSLYLVGILMAALALAVVQTMGYWSRLFTASFAPLGAPWYVLLYGLLGGCISCIMALGRINRPTAPGFVMLTWFARPFLGMVLAALAYLALSSGLFIISVVPAQRYAIYSVVGAIAGLCEGWLFFRRK
jgi:cation transport regulator ChaC